MRRQMGQVAVDRDGHGMFLMSRQVIKMQRTELFVHQRSRAGADCLQVKALIRNDLLTCFVPVS